MSYQVTARKWRPQTFAEVVGQDHVTRTLQNALRQSRIAHAYLFAGTRGVGKTTTARLLAKALNCENGPTADPCNRCSLCQETTAGSALDVLEIDGASNRGIDEIRDLRDKIRYAPVRGRYKIYIIDEVHMLTEYAFNALLKTLEEPPPQVVFIFATTEPHKVPITILSRCQRFDFRKVASTEIADCLGKIAAHEGTQISPAALLRIARRAEGSLRDAQTLFDQVRAFCGPVVQDEHLGPMLGLAGEEQIQRLMEAILARDARPVLEVLSQLFQEAHDTREICRQLLAYVRDLVVVKVASDTSGALDRSSAEVERLQKLGAQASIEELHTLFQLLTDTEMRVRDSAQPGWVLEISLIRLASLPRLESLSSLVARLETLDRRLAQTPERAREGVPATPPMVRESAPGEKPPMMTNVDEALPPAPSIIPPAPMETDTPPDLVQKIIDSVSNRALGWILEQHCKVQVTAAALEIVFHGNNRMARELLQEAETLRTLQEVARATIGREIAVRIVDIPVPSGDAMATEPSPLEVGSDLTSLSQASIVRETLELFGGRILEVRQRTVNRHVTARPIGEEEMAGEEEQDDE